MQRNWYDSRVAPTWTTSAGGRPVSSRHASQADDNVGVPRWRARMEAARGWCRFDPERPEAADPRIAALAAAIKGRRIVRICFGSPRQRVLHPAGLTLRSDGGMWWTRRCRTDRYP